MARSSRRKAPARAERTARTKSKKAAPAQEVEVVEEEAGLGMEDGIIILTAIVLLVAFFFVDYSRGAYQEGLFFKRSVSASAD